MNNELLIYYQQIRDHLSCNSATAEKIINELQENIQQTLRNNPTISFDAILQIYGSPDEIVTAYWDSLEKEDYFEKIKVKKRNRKIIGIICICIIGVVLALYLHTYIDGANNNAVYYTETITED